MTEGLSNTASGVTFTFPTHRLIGYDIRVMKYPSGFTVESRALYKERHICTGYETVKTFADEKSAVDFAKQINASGKNPLEGEEVWSNGGAAALDIYRACLSYDKRNM